MSTQVADCGCYVDWSRGDFGPGCRGHWIEDSECKYKEPQPAAPGLVEAVERVLQAVNSGGLDLLCERIRDLRAALAAHRAQGERK